MITTSYIVDLVNNNVAAAKRAIVVLYSYQTQDEKQVRTTRHLNHMGFSMRTCKKGTELAVKLLRGCELSAEEIQTARNIAVIHRRQLVIAAKEKAARQLAEAH